MIADTLRGLIEAERERFEVPGVAVAVVRNDDVLLCDGFGERVMGSAPVTADTHFPIASDTKCFTAATLCVQADQGLLDLDAPVRDVIPWFAMADDHATALVSVRDLLSHRTGLPRHDFVWYGGDGFALPLEQIARSLRHLPLSRQVRQTWQYNNLCYSTAGYVTEVLAGKPWRDAVRDALLIPLGMKRTVFGARDESISEIATPYKKVDDGYESHELPAGSGDRPAGAIVSTAAELALWLRARLGGGALSDNVLRQLHAPTMIGGAGMLDIYAEVQPMGYALGCQVASYRGRRIVDHGGNLVGYSSQILVAPEDGIGIAVLTNLHGTALRDALPLVLLDALLDLEPLPWGERHREAEVAGRAGAKEVLAARADEASTEPPTRPLGDFAGAFEHPAYGTLTLTVDGDELVPDFHDLGDRIRIIHRGRDRFELFLTEFDSGMPLIPQLGRDDDIVGYAINIEPLVAPIVFTRQRPVASPDLIDRLLGQWHMGPHELAVFRQGEALRARMPSGSAIPLDYDGGTTFTSTALPALRIIVRESDLLVDPLGAFTRTEE